MYDDCNNQIDFGVLADLSKLEFDECENNEIKKELDEFLALINWIKDVDCSEMNTEGDCQKYNVFREDIESDCRYTSDVMLSNAKTCNDGYITVPRVLEENDNDR